MSPIPRRRPNRDDLISQLLNEQPVMAGSQSPPNSDEMSHIIDDTCRRVGIRSVADVNANPDFLSMMLPTSSDSLNLPRHRTVSSSNSDRFAHVDQLFHMSTGLVSPAAISNLRRELELTAPPLPTIAPISNPSRDQIAPPLSLSPQPMSHSPLPAMNASPSFHPSAAPVRSSSSHSIRNVSDETQAFYARIAAVHALADLKERRRLQAELRSAEKITRLRTHVSVPLHQMPAPPVPAAHFKRSHKKTKRNKNRKNKKRAVSDAIRKFQSASAALNLKAPVDLQQLSSLTQSLEHLTDAVEEAHQADQVETQSNDSSGSGTESETDSESEHEASVQIEMADLPNNLFETDVRPPGHKQMSESEIHFWQRLSKMSHEECSDLLKPLMQQSKSKKKMKSKPMSASPSTSTLPAEHYAQQIASKTAALERLALRENEYRAALEYYRSGQLPRSQAQPQASTPLRQTISRVAQLPAWSPVSAILRSPSVHKIEAVAEEIADPIDDTARPIQYSEPNVDEFLPLQAMLTRQLRFRFAAPCVFFKQVAVVGNRYYSVIDGQTEFCNGVEMSCDLPIVESKSADLYHSLKRLQVLHTSPQRALCEAFPPSSRLRGCPRAILRVVAHGEFVVAPPLHSDPDAFADLLTPRPSLLDTPHSADSSHTETWQRAAFVFAHFTPTEVVAWLPNAAAARQLLQSPRTSETRQQQSSPVPSDTAPVQLSPTRAFSVRSITDLEIEHYLAELNLSSTRSFSSLLAPEDPNKPIRNRFFKIVATVGHKYRAINDPLVEFQAGCVLTQDLPRFQSDIDALQCVFASESLAKQEVFSRHAPLASCPRALIQFQVPNSAQYVSLGEGKFLIDQLITEKVLAWTPAGADGKVAASPEKVMPWFY